MAAREAYAHTPGPWRVSCGCLKPPRGQRPFAEVVLAIGGNREGWTSSDEQRADSDRFATVARTWAKDIDEALANGRLIAAAPELLQALQAVMADYDRFGERVYGDTIDQARAVILRATGEE